jgi:membrane-associated phospholipid phosphatase
MLIIGGLMLVYFSVRGVTEGDPTRAFQNAADIIRFERLIDIGQEHALQAPVLDHAWLRALANWVYIYGHWPVILSTFVVLAIWRPERFRVLRNAMAISGGIGFIFFFALPVAPPRFTDPQIVDTVTAYSSSYRTLQPPSLSNLYASMPSLHAGWNLIVGVVIFTTFTSFAMRAFALAMPAAMSLATIVTGNHYIVDVVVGVAIALTGLIAARQLDRRSRAIVREDARSRSAIGPVQPAYVSAEVRRRAPSG